MKRPGIDGNFMLCWGLNLVLNIFWALPAVVLFITHFALGTPLWWAGLAFGLWIAGCFAATLFLSMLGTTGKSNGAGTGMRGSGTIRYSSQGQHHVDGSKDA